MIRGSLVGPRGGPAQDSGVSHPWPAFVLGLLLLAVATVLGPSGGPRPGDSHHPSAGPGPPAPAPLPLQGHHSLSLPCVGQGREGLSDPNTTAGAWLCNQRIAQLSVSQALLAAGIRGSPASNTDPQAPPRDLGDLPPRGSSDWARTGALADWLSAVHLERRGSAQLSQTRRRCQAASPPSPFNVGV